jgi:putative Mg2+ transporter-C (MgtC) family protein
MHIREFILRLLMATACGLLIGLERQWNRKKAGIRTNSLVALGSAVFVLLSFDLVAGYGGDVTRIVGQVITGIGFLCAGVIMHQGLNVQGLTTSATIWCSSAVGCIAASGYYIEALFSTLLILFVNGVLKNADRWINRKAKGEEDGGEVEDY